MTIAAYCGSKSPETINNSKEEAMSKNPDQITENKPRLVAALIPLLVLGGAFILKNTEILATYYGNFWSFAVAIALFSLGPAFLLIRLTDGKYDKAFKLVLVFWSIVAFVAILGFGPAQMAGRLGEATIAVIIMLCAFLCGNSLCRFFLPENAKSLERLFLSVVLGLGTISILTLVAGALIGLNIYTGIIILLACAVFGLTNIRNTFANLRTAINEAANNYGMLEILLLSMVAAGIIMCLPCAFIPPLDYDVTEYHVQLPREYLWMGKIAFRPLNAFSGMPQNMEMITSLCYSLRGENGWIAAKLLHWSFLPLLGGLCALAASRLGGKRAAIFALAVLMLSPMSADLARKLYVELGMCAYGIAGLLVLLIMRDQVFSKGGLLLCGIFAGLSAGTKYPGLIFFASPLVVFPFFSGTEIKIKNWKIPAMIILGIALSFGPWLIKNAIETGNPVYPIWNKTLKVSDWSDTQNERFRQAHRPVKEGDFSASGIYAMTRRTFVDSVELMPFAFMLLGFLFLKNRIDESKNGSAKLTVKALVVWWALVFIMWLALTHRLERFLYPLHALAAILAGVGLSRLREKKHVCAGAGLVGALMLFVQLAVLLGIYFMDPTKPSGVALGTEARPMLMQKVSGWRAGQLLGQLPKDSKVLALGDAEGFHLPRNTQTAVVFSNHPLETMLKSSANADELREKFRKAGYTHIYIKWSELARLHGTYYKAYDFTTEEQTLLREFLFKYVDQVVPLASQWPEWEADMILPESAQKDFEHFRKRFNIKTEIIYSGSPYQRARPWLAGLCPKDNSSGSVPPETYQTKLFADYSALLEPTDTGAPPPLGFAPLECLVLK